MHFLTFIILFVLLTFPNSAFANDGVYFTSGSFLVPVKETDISAKKEILTITICKDGYADVDVDYTFYNNSSEKKNLTMAFEAHSPYNSGASLNKDGNHPFISKFTVDMNGAQLKHRNALVALHLINENWETDHKPLNMSQWKGIGEVPDSIIPFENALYCEALDSAVSYAYAYYFDATFNPGENKVHHTYRYKMSFSIGSKFEIPYWLTPVTRWANGQVDDFTLRIKTDGEIEKILLADSLFKGCEFKSFYPPVYHINHKWLGSCIFATVGELPLEWHTVNFVPQADMRIESGDNLYSYEMHKWDTEGTVIIDKDGNASRYLADTDDGYFVLAQDYGVIPREEAHIEECSAEKGQGIVYLNEDTKAANIRIAPSVKSKVLCVIKDKDGELPTVYKCLGIAEQRLSDGTSKLWFKIKVNGKTGYVSRNLMIWDSICTF